MRQHISDFTHDEKKLILELFLEGYTIEEISILSEIPFYEVLYVLRKIYDKVDYDKYASFATIDNPRVLIISDTHIGSRYENMDYIKEAYHFAEAHGISIVLHGGDLIQSTFSNVQPIYQDETRQIDHLVNDYPTFPGVQNYILLGNHDLNTFRKDNRYIKELESRKDFNIMGYKKGYLTWCDLLISLNHPAKKYHISIPDVPTDLNLRGHSHRLSYNRTRTIHIPTLSDDLIFNFNARPGFLVGTIKNNYLVLDSYYFKESLHREGPILTRRLK